MVVGIGVVGTGTMGVEHARHLAQSISGSEVRALSDIDYSLASSIGQTLGGKVYKDGEDVIQDSAVDAVVIATPADSHVELVLNCIGATKPVFCEKPLARSALDAFRVVEAENAQRRRFVRMGFMRRFDEGYRSIKREMEAQSLGDPLIMYCQHRNPHASESFSSEMSFSEAVVHEIDAARWLLGEEIDTATVVPVRPSGLAQSMSDPQLVLLRTEGGRVVLVEVFQNCQYGYEVQCEAVGSLGVMALDRSGSALLRRDGVSSRVISEDFRDRFRQAFWAELQDWVHSLEDGTVGGPSAWDGYVATAVAESCIESLRSGATAVVSIGVRPDIYD